MLKRLFILAFLVFFISFTSVSPSYAGLTGKILGELGMDEEVQNMGDALQSETTALASGAAWRLTGALKGKTVDSVRGASGALAELALNYGDLICNAWIISFRVRIRNMVIDNVALSGDAQAQHSRLIQKMQQFADKLEIECTRVGFMGPTGPVDNSGASSAGGGGEATEPPKEEWRIQPRDGETVGDAICRHKCGSLWLAMREEERELAKVEKSKQSADEQVKEKQASLTKKQKELSDAQKELEETGRIIKEGINGNDSSAKKNAYVKAGQRNRIAEATVNRLTPEVAKAQEELSSAQSFAASVASSLRWQQGRTDKARQAYFDCVRNCVSAATAAGEKMTLKCPDDFPCPTTPQQAQEKSVPPRQIQKSTCAYPKQTQSILIGANGEVGSGAALKDKVKGQAKGMALGALNNVIGGSGFSLGGGGNKSKGPKTEKDPTRKLKYSSVRAGETELGVRSMYTQDGLLVSAKVLESPGDGTFHAMWLEDEDGNRYLPTRYLIYDLYRDWKLTVWWTEDHYVNGQHVSHDEGKEVTVGRDEATFMKRFEGQEGAGNSIWSQLGFNNASKGVQSLGAVFDVPPAVLNSGCPLRLVTHVSLPKQDPVVTQPVVVYLKIDSTKNQVVVSSGVATDGAEVPLPAGVTDGQAVSETPVASPPVQKQPPKTSGKTKSKKKPSYN